MLFLRTIAISWLLILISMCQNTRHHISSYSTLSLLIQTLPLPLVLCDISTSNDEMWGKNRVRFEKYDKRQPEVMFLFNYCFTTTSCMTNCWQTGLSHLNCGMGRPQARGSWAKNDSHLLPNKQKLSHTPTQRWSSSALATITRSRPRIVSSFVNLKPALFMSRERGLC